MHRFGMHRFGMHQFGMLHFGGQWSGMLRFERVSGLKYIDWKCSHLFGIHRFDIHQLEILNSKLKHRIPN